MSAPPRKNNDFGGFGDVRNGLAQQGAQRHDKNVRPPAGAAAELVQHAWRGKRAADCLRFVSPAEATWRFEILGLGSYEHCSRAGAKLQLW